MSNNATKPNTSNKKATKPKTKSGKKPISTKHISMPGNRKIKMNFTKWVMLITIIALLVLVLVTYPNRAIRSDIKALESRDDINAYCADKNLNCTYTILADYDIEGFKVARVAFLDDDFFGTADAAENGSNTGSETSSKQPKNVYITVQKGESVEVPK